MFRLISLVLGVFLLIVGWFVLDPTALPAAAAPALPVFVSAHNSLAKVIPVSEVSSQLSAKFAEIAVISKSGNALGKHVVLDNLVSGIASEISRLPSDKAEELRALLCATSSGMTSPEASAATE